MARKWCPAKRSATVATGADRTDLLAVPVEFLVRAKVRALEQVAQFMIDRRVVTQGALGEVVGDVHHCLAAQVVDDDFRVRVQQQRDAVGNCLVVIQGHLFRVLFRRGRNRTFMVAAKRLGHKAGGCRASYRCQHYQTHKFTPHMR